MLCQRQEFSMTLSYKSFFTNSVCFLHGRQKEGTVFSADGRRERLSSSMPQLGPLLARVRQNSLPAYTCVYISHPCSSVATCAFFTLHSLPVFVYLVCLCSCPREDEDQLRKVRVLLESSFSALFYFFLEQKKTADAKPSVSMQADNTLHEESSWQSLISLSTGSR